jgi:hypothetical protein
MRRTELIAAAIFFLLGAHVVQQSTGLDYWAKYGPGPGFLPFWMGVAWMGLSALHMGNIALQPQLYQGPQPFPRGQGAIRVGTLLGILLVSTFLMEIVGFLIALIVMVAACLKGIDHMKWRTSVLASVAIAATFYLIFAVAIGVPFPKGPLGV